MSGAEHDFTSVELIVYLASYFSKDNKTAPYHFEKSIEILKHIKAYNELARAHAGYGRFCNSEGRVEEAKEHLSKALEIFERIGTLVEPEKIREELIGLAKRVPVNLPI